MDVFHPLYAWPSLLKSQIKIPIWTLIRKETHFGPISSSKWSRSKLSRRNARPMRAQNVTVPSGTIEEQMCVILKKLSFITLYPIHAKWLVSLCDHLRSNRPVPTKTYFRIVGIDDILLEELEPEDPFVDL